MAEDTAPRGAASKEITRVTIPVYGFTCAGCDVLEIEQALQRLAGIQNVYVNAGTEMAYVAFDASACTLHQLLTAIEQAGFEPGQPSFR